MLIKPASAIQEDYAAISALCKETREPVFLTVAGEGDLVVEDLQTYRRRQKETELAQILADIEHERLNGAPYYTIDELRAHLDAVIEEAVRDAAK